MKVADVLIVENLSNKISENKVKEALSNIDVNEVDKVIINKIHIPGFSDDNVIGIHVIVREVAEA
ncbi:hypothetical protein DFR86_09660 [Acidianus sulfidivorans JP7]|uniref:Uncharacterized protein n=1 Tax=Acidianus sulfidivorans JP7 TaxID=619593 RepID=A0A2U9IP72_9CREN|nr:hypothetical protein [Acidianus sulfidivorans]AWR97787.1 hypothetical protein DFR86_09660 [Acidianus sulfidivorans JP7]